MNKYIEKLAETDTGTEVGSALGFYTGVAAGGFGGHKAGKVIGGKVFDNKKTTKASLTKSRNLIADGVKNLHTEIANGPMRINSSKKFEESKSILRALTSNKNKYVAQVGKRSAIGGAISGAIFGSVAGRAAFKKKSIEKKASEYLEFLDKSAMDLSSMTPSAPKVAIGATAATSGKTGAYHRQISHLPNDKALPGDHTMTKAANKVGQALQAGLKATRDTLKSAPKATVPAHELPFVSRAAKGVGASVDSFMKTVSGHDVRMLTATRTNHVPDGGVANLGWMKKRKLERFNNMSDTEMRGLLKDPADKADFDKAVLKRTGARVLGVTGAGYAAHKYLDGQSRQPSYGNYNSY